MSTRDKEEPFLSRWSRRKLEDTERTAEPPMPEEDAVPAEVPAEEDAVAIDDLPDVDTLDKDSDFTVFMREGVPEELRTLALRKLWLSDPVFANLDGLNDYDQDFNGLLKAGAEFMKRVAEAGEKLVRSDAETGDTAGHTVNDPAADAAPPVAQGDDQTDDTEPVGDGAVRTPHPPEDSETI